jgi:hypothetical protein
MLLYFVVVTSTDDRLHSGVEYTVKINDTVSRFNIPGV